MLAVQAVGNAIFRVQQVKQGRSVLGNTGGPGDYFVKLAHFFYKVLSIRPDVDIDRESFIIYLHFNHYFGSRHFRKRTVHQGFIDVQDQGLFEFVFRSFLGQVIGELRFFIHGSHQFALIVFLFSIHVFNTFVGHLIPLLPSS